MIFVANNKYIKLDIETMPSETNNSINEFTMRHRGSAQRGQVNPVQLPE